jgi:hypothetical protein
LCSFLLQVLLDDVHEAAPDGPLAIHPLCHLAEHVELERQDVRVALDRARDEACLLEHLHVLGDRRLGYAEARGRIAEGRPPGAEPLPVVYSSRSCL